MVFFSCFNPLGANSTKCSNTLKQFWVWVCSTAHKVAEFFQNFMLTRCVSNISQQKQLEYLINNFLILKIVINMSSKLRVLLSTNLFGYIEFNFERRKFVDWWILIPEKTQEIKHCDWYYALIPCYEERCLELQKKKEYQLIFSPL